MYLRTLISTVCFEPSKWCFEHTSQSQQNPHGATLSKTFLAGQITSKVPILWCSTSVSVVLEKHGNGITHLNFKNLTLHYIEPYKWCFEQLPIYLTLAATKTHNVQHFLAGQKQNNQFDKPSKWKTLWGNLCYFFLIRPTKISLKRHNIFWTIDNAQLQSLILISISIFHEINTGLKRVDWYFTIKHV